jgi:hypothetical protein
VWVGFVLKNKMGVGKGVEGGSWLFVPVHRCGHPPTLYTVGNRGGSFL